MLQAFLGFEPAKKLIDLKCARGLALQVLINKERRQFKDVARAWCFLCEDLVLKTQVCLAEVMQQGDDCQPIELGVAQRPGV
jgi:hypothetical protein